ncbi:MAG: outer membrane beta-barrel protein [Myxococcales bacterium]
MPHRDQGNDPRVAAAVRVATGLALLLVTFATPAVAQVTEPPKPELFPDPSKFAYGLYTQGELGAVTVLGTAGPHLRPGWALGLAVGYDLTRWLAVEARGVGSTHTTEFQNAPQDGELMQLYHLSGALKVSLRYRYLALSADGGAGLLRTSTNVLATAGLNERRTSLVFGGGLAGEYHTLSRHFSFGIHLSFFEAAALARSHMLNTMASLRYAF